MSDCLLVQVITYLVKGNGGSMEAEATDVRPENVVCGLGFFLPELILSIVSGEMAPVDPEKLAKLVKRQQTYGDITQSATVGQLELLLSMFNNDVPEVGLDATVPEAKINMCSS